jgi:hypothetical protein
MKKLSVGTFINAHKILVTPVVLGLMCFYRNWSTEAFVYLALHGTYSLLWLLKQTYFPDRRFAERVPLGIGLGFIFVPLAGKGRHQVNLQQSEEKANQQTDDCTEPTYEWFY